MPRTVQSHTFDDVIYVKMKSKKCATYVWGICSILELFEALVLIGNVFNYEVRHPEIVSIFPYTRLTILKERRLEGTGYIDISDHTADPAPSYL